jgi:hypothetical protein
MGAAAFTSELANKNADFLFSRAVRWWKLLLAKILAGLGMMLASAVIAAVVYRVLCPDQYVRFATLGGLGVGVLYGVVMMAIGYAMGLSCAAVLPGVSGSVLVAICLVMFSQALVILAKGWSDVIYFPYYYIYAVYLGPPVAMVLIARSRLTRPVASRAVLFAAVVVPIMFAGLVLDKLAPARYSLPIEAAAPNVSPDAKYVVYWHADGVAQITRMADSETRRLPIVPTDVGRYTFYWAGDSTLFFPVFDNHGYRLRTFRMGRDGNLAERSIKIGPEHQGYPLVIPSPKGGLAMVIWLSLSGRPFQPSEYEQRSTHTPGPEDMHSSVTGRVEPVDVLGGKSLGVIARDAQWFWWQTNDSIGYLNKQGVRHVLLLRPHGR